MICVRLHENLENESATKGPYLRGRQRDILGYTNGGCTTILAEPGSRKNGHPTCYDIKCAVRGLDIYLVANWLPSACRLLSPLDNHLLITIIRCCKDGKTFEVKIGVDQDRILLRPRIGRNTSVHSKTACSSCRYGA